MQLNNKAEWGKIMVWNFYEWCQKREIMQKKKVTEYYWKQKN